MTDDQCFIKKMHTNIYLIHNNNYLDNDSLMF